MPNVSISGLADAWVTFANHGPVTTTYTPPTSCSATDRYRLGTVTQGVPLYDFAQVACPSTSSWDCVPSGTAVATITALVDHDGQRYVGSGGYYSLGLYCPSGWATVGLMARDASEELSSSGVLSSHTRSAMENPVAFDPATYLAGLLRPSETVALCCPSAMTPDKMGGCYSVVEDYRPSAACTVSTKTFYEYGSTTLVLEDGETTHTTAGQVPTSMSLSVTTKSSTLNARRKSELTGIAYAEMVTLMHHSSDFTERMTADETSSETAPSETSAGTGTAAPTTNAAARLARRGSTWDGLGAVLGISVAAVALGAAIVLPL